MKISRQFWSIYRTSSNNCCYTNISYVTIEFTYLFCINFVTILTRRYDWLTLSYFLIRYHTRCKADVVNLFIMCGCLAYGGFRMDPLLRFGVTSPTALMDDCHMSKISSKPTFLFMKFQFPFFLHRLCNDLDSNI